MKLMSVTADKHHAKMEDGVCTLEGGWAWLRAASECFYHYLYIYLLYIYFILYIYIYIICPVVFKDMPVGVRRIIVGHPWFELLISVAIMVTWRNSEFVHLDVPEGLVMSSSFGQAKVYLFGRGENWLWELWNERIIPDISRCLLAGLTSVSCWHLKMFQAEKLITELNLYFRATVLMGCYCMKKLRTVCNMIYLPMRGVSWHDTFIMAW